MLRLFGCPYIILNNIQRKRWVSMDYISVLEAAKKWGISERRVQKPKDARFKTMNKNNSQVLKERRKNEKNIDN